MVLVATGVLSRLYARGMRVPLGAGAVEAAEDLDDGASVLDRIFRTYQRIMKIGRLPFARMFISQPPRTMCLGILGPLDGKLLVQVSAFC